MRIHLLAAVLPLIAAHPLSASNATPPHHDNKNTCISTPDASLIATSFGLTISNYTEALAVRLFTTDFTDQSDSASTLIHEPGLQPQDLGVLTFSSRAEFLAAQGAQPSVPFKILKLWNTCGTVIIRWQSDQTPYEVQGISIASVVPVSEGQGGGGFGVGDQKWQISSVVAEFNSGAWLGNLGNPECKTVSN